MAYTPEEIKALKIRQSLKRRLWAAMIGEQAFLNVQTTAQSYLDAGLDTKHSLHYTYLSSIVVTYCKVFTGANIVPSLPKQFWHFSDFDLEHSHESLLMARNNIYAHADSTFLKYKLEAEVWLDKATTTGFTLRLNTPNLNAGNVPIILRLVNFQLARLIPYREELANELLPERIILSTLSGERSNHTRINIKWPSIFDSPRTW